MVVKSLTVTARDDACRCDYESDERSETSFIIGVRW
jgi:hypothetical protein